MLHGFDNWGHDLPGNPRKNVASEHDCATLCEKTAACKGFTYRPAPKDCYLKSVPHGEEIKRDEKAICAPCGIGAASSEAPGGMG